MIRLPRSVLRLVPADAGLYMSLMLQPRLEVAPLSSASIGLIVEYLAGLSDGDIERMGMRREQLPGPEALSAALQRSVDQAPDQRGEAYLLWLKDRQPIGYAALKRIQFGLYGDMHLHVVAERERGRGLGASLFCLSALHFFERYQLQVCLCEPKATNVGPNRMLQKVGFPLLKTFCGCSSDLTYPADISQYLIQVDVARAYLARVGGLRA